jgi:hypothetical protein
MDVGGKTPWLPVLHPPNARPTADTNNNLVSSRMGPLLNMMRVLSKHRGSSITRAHCDLGRMSGKASLARLLDWRSARGLASYREGMCQAPAPARRMLVFEGGKQPG